MSVKSGQILLVSVALSLLALARLSGFSSGVSPILTSRLFSAASSGCAYPDRMVWVQAGPFWMGSNPAERRLAYALSTEGVREARWFDAELRLRRLHLPAFCIDRFLVTQAAYAAFVVATGHRPPGISKEDYQRQGFLVHDYDREVTRYLWDDGTPPAGRGDHPVVLVSADDATAYCRWRSAGGRLPTEAEWEKAARGEDGRIFPWGNQWDPEQLNSAARGPDGTTPVARYPGGMSPYGLFDAVGNVFQWTSSALPDGRRIVKGCAWDDDPGLCRPAFRHARPPESRHILIGFRCGGSGRNPKRRRGLGQDGPGRAEPGLAAPSRVEGASHAIPGSRGCFRLPRSQHRCVVDVVRWTPIGGLHLPLTGEMPSSWGRRAPRLCEKLSMTPTVVSSTESP